MTSHGSSTGVPLWLLAACCVAASLSGCGAGDGNDDPTGISFSQGDASATLDGEAGLDAANGIDASAGGEDVSPSDDAARGQRGACAADHCAIEGSCFANGKRNPKNPCQVCLTVVAGDDWTLDDTAPCDDGKACTSDDTCVDGACVGKALGCDDSNPCTDDSCATGADGAAKCTNANNTNPCSDGDVCSVGDVCGDAKCANGTPRNCDDGNACTVDSCDPGAGCKNDAKSGLSCDDGELCTVADTCLAGACKPGKLNPCDDNDACTLDGCEWAKGCKHKDIAPLCKDESVCTDDSCDPKQGCVYTFTTATCDDLSKCTANDQCTAGICTGAKVPTDDGNPCTNDSCTPLLGVVHEANTLPCDDGDKCTVDDSCLTAKCVAGLPRECTDSNACTDNGCNAQTGCIYEPNKDPCDDGSACTKDDTCADSKCAGAKIDCDDGNACTADSCDPGTADTKGKGCENTLIVSNACRPTIAVTYPKRGATIKQTSSSVTVKGTVKSGAGPIKSFTLNGANVAVKSDGSFSYTRKSGVGGNTLVFDAEDSMGSKRHRVQAYLWSQKYFKPEKSKPKSGMVAPGMAFFMDDKTIDDGDHSLPPNDLATIFELYFKSMDIEKLLAAGKKNPNDPDFEYSFIGLKYKIYIKKVTNGTPQVSLKPVTGALKLTATIPDLKADLLITRPKLFGGTAKYDGKVTSTSVVITSTIYTKVVNGKIQTDVKDTTVVLNGFTIKVTGGLGGALLNGILNLFKGTVKSQLQTAFKSSIADQIGPAVASALNAMALSFSFDLPRLDDPEKKIKVDVITDIWSTDIKPDGARFDMRAGAYASKLNTVSNLGVPGRIGCGTGKQVLHMLRQDKLELGLADDALNSVLYAAWLGGLLEFPLPASMLGAVDLKQYGITELSMKAKALLAPTIMDCNTKKAPKAHIGDFRIDATMKLLGQKMDVVLWATFTAGVKIEAKNGKLSVALTEIETIDTEVNVVQEKLIGSEELIDKMISESLVKGLMGALAGKPLGEFPLPVIDLSKAVSGLPKGTGIEIDPKKVTRKEGNSIVGGQLK